MSGQTAGIVLLAVAAVSLFAESLWRDLTGRLTGGMIVARAAMIPVIVVGLYLVLGDLGWPWYARLPVAIVGGWFGLWYIGYYVIMGISVMLVRATGRMPTNPPPA